MILSKKYYVFLLEASKAQFTTTQLVTINVNVVEKQKEIIEMIYGDSKPKYLNNDVISSNKNCIQKDSYEYISKEYNF